MIMCIQNLVRFRPFILKILSGNGILTTIKGRNSVKNLRKMTLYNSNLYLVNIDVHTKFGQSLSIGSREIKVERNDRIKEGQGEFSTALLFQRRLSPLFQSGCKEK